MGYLYFHLLNISKKLPFIYNLNNVRLSEVLITVLATLSYTICVQHVISFSHLESFIQLLFQRFLKTKYFEEVLCIATEFCNS